MESVGGDSTSKNRQLSKQSSKRMTLVGKDRRVADIPVDHPSCSKQHAVFQFRTKKPGNARGEGNTGLYLIDLGSANGTFVNHEEIPKQRFYELRHKDIIQFGASTREYVLLREDLLES